MAALKADDRLSARTANESGCHGRRGNPLKSTDGVTDRERTGEIGGDGGGTGGGGISGCLWSTIKFLMAVTVFHASVYPRTVASSPASSSSSSSSSAAASSSNVLVRQRLSPYISVSNNNNNYNYNNNNNNNNYNNDLILRPIFRQTANNITVSPGDRAVLRCRIDNLGTKTVTWKKQSEVHPLTIGMHPFAPDSRISVDFNQRMSEWSLIIQDVGPMDEGVYQCQISTKNELDTYDIILNVKNILVSGTEYVERGGTIQLICNATGKPDPPQDVEWYRGNSNPIHSDARHGVIITKKIETKVLVSMLVITDSKLADAGLYTCRSSDLDTATITVHILNVAPPIDKRRTIPDRITGLRNKSTAAKTKNWTLVCLAIISLFAFTSR